MSARGPEEYESDGDTPDYPPKIAELLKEERLAPLGPGTPNESVRAALAALTIESAFAPHPVRDRDMAAACLAGLWLYHDFLDESHTISQEIDTPTGSYWHAILHRREPDASNASYWFRRVGQHPIFEMLTRAANKLGYQPDSTRWGPVAFIEWCEKYRETGTEEEMLLRRVQQREWELLFGWCYTHTVEAG